MNEPQAHRRSRASYPWHLCTLWGTLWALLIVGTVLGTQDAKAQVPAAAAPQTNPGQTNPGHTNPGQIDRDIEDWIRRLGSDSYTERSEAQRRLESYGIRALDALRQAVQSNDPQIANQARFLLKSNHLEQSWSYDPLETRKIIEAYKVATSAGKAQHIRELNELSNNQGVPTLCKICCYETDELISKLAAKELLSRLSERKIPGVDANSPLRDAFDPKLVRALLESADQDSKELVIKGVEGATSRAASWVQLAYSAQTPWPSERWIEILDQEQKLLQQSSSETKLSLFVELTTWVAQQARLETGDKQIALRIAARIPPILLSSQPDPDKLVAFAEWALGADLPELVQEQYTQLPKQFPHTIPPILHYLLAESIARQGNKELADQIAKYALARKSVVLEQGKLIEAPESGSALPVPQNRLQFRSINFDYERTLMAQLLINRGSFERAESELREVVKGQEDSPDSVFAISLRSLAMMLHEQDRDLEAAQALEKWVERYETEKLFRMQVDEYQMDLASNYYLYFANHLAKEGKSDQARESYFKAIALEPDNVDALIGLAKLSETPEEKQRRLAEQEKTISLMRNEIEAIDRDLRLANPMFQAAERSKLANSLNTLAWLMINTECDPREALMLSRRSCGLSPNQSAYQDTLAHCLDKNGKHRDAFRTQIKALSLEPHQLSLQRALVRFYQKAIEETSATSK